MKIKLSFLLFLFSIQSFGQTVTWTGGGSANQWFDKDNWDSGDVPCSACDVVIENDSVVYEEKTTTVRSVSLDNSGVLNVHSGELTIDGNNNFAVAYGLSVKGGCRAYNSGALGINNTYSYGIRIYSMASFENFYGLGVNYCQGRGISNSGTFINANSGIIKMNTITDEGFYNSGVVSNAGDISIGDVLHNGFGNFGVLQNLSSGILAINNAVEHGIRNNNFFNNEGTCVIEGVTKLAPNPAGGITNGDSLINDGIVQISAIEGHGVKSFGGSGVSINNNQLTISDIENSGLSIDNFFENNGVIDIDDALENGIIITDTLENSGDIYINEVVKSGIKLVFTSDFFKNLNGARVFIDGCSEHGIFNASTIQNFGEIDISNVPLGGTAGVLNERGLSTGNTTFNNHGALSIETCFTGIKNSGYANTLFQNMASGVIDIENTTFYGFQNTRQVLNHGVINIDNTQQNAFENSGTEASSNFGTINISNSDKMGLKNSGSDFINMSGADIFVETTLDHGFYNSNGFTNQGNVDIGWSSKSGISNFNGDLKNTGTIAIRHTTESGIRNAGSSGNGIFLNDESGIVKIDTASTTGIDNTAKLKNKGIVVIINTQLAGVLNDSNEDTLINEGDFYIYESATVGFENSGTSASVLYNKSGAIINVYNSLGTGFYTSRAVRNEGKLYVTGSSSTGFLNMNNADSLINNGNIEVWNGEEDGLWNNGAGSVLINNSTITTLFNEGIGIKNTQKFKNSGTIRIRDNVGTGLLNFENGDTLINSGLLRIYDCDSTGFENSGLGSIFLNETGGTVEFDAMREGIKTSSKFINKGEIEILEMSKISLINDTNTDSLLNFGTIHIVDGDSIGLENIGTGSVFINEVSGLLDIEETQDVGLHSQELLVNKGKINIHGDNQQEGVLNENNSAGFYNYGELTTNGLYGFYTLFSVFSNETCGRMNIKNGIFIKTGGSAVNDGLIEQYRGFSENIVGDFQNNGVFVFQRGIQELPGSFINDGMVVRAPLGGFSSGIKEMNVIEQGVGGGFTMANSWWTNPSKTIVGGGADLFEGSLTPNSASLSADTLYFEIDNGTCLFTSKVPVNTSLTCPFTPEVATFSQAVSTDWHTPENWDTGYVPNQCTVAVIPSSKKCTILSGRKARALRIESETGSIFDAALGVMLETFE